MTKSADYFAKGLWNFFCDFCGAKRKSSDGVKSWQGNWICKEHKEVRNPQDFLKGIKDDQSVPWSRPEPSDQFIPVCTAEGRSAVPELAIPGCMVPGRAFQTGIPVPYAFCTMFSVQARADYGSADCATTGRIT